MLSEFLVSLVSPVHLVHLNLITLTSLGDVTNSQFSHYINLSISMLFPHLDPYIPLLP
jgi:hypothetical protein